MFVYLLTILLVRTVPEFIVACISFIIRNQFENEIESDLLKMKKFRVPKLPKVARLYWQDTLMVVHT